MSVIEHDKRLTDALPSKAIRHGSDLRRVNSLVAVAVVVLLALAPIPLGSNRPAFAAMWSVYIGLLVAMYGLALLLLRTKAPRPPRRYVLEIGLFLGLLGFIAVQILPLADWLPPTWLHDVRMGVGRPSLSYDPGASALTFIRFVTFGLLLFLVMQVSTNRRRARGMLVAIYFVIAGFAVVGLVSLTQLGDTLLGFEKQNYRGFATGTFINRNSYATFLAVGATLGVALLFQLLADRYTRGIRQTLTWVAAIGMGLLVVVSALVATGSRLGTVACAVGVVTAIGTGILFSGGSRRLGATLSLGGLVVAMVAVSIFGTSLVERFVLLPGVDAGRVEAHKIIWGAIFERPWLGYGAGSFPTVFQMLQAAPLSGAYVWEHSHSTYLALWFEMGLVAGSVPLVIVGLLVVRAIVAAAEPANVVLSVCAIGTTVVFAVHSTLDFSAEIEANALLFTVLLGLGATGARGRRQDEPQYARN